MKAPTLTPITSSPTLCCAFAHLCRHKCVCVWKPLETSWAATPLGPWCADSSLLSLAPLSTGALTMPVVPMTGKVFLPFMTTGGKTLTHPSSPPHVRAPLYIYGCLHSAQGTFGAAPKHKAMYNDVILSGTRKFVVVDHLLTKVCVPLSSPPPPPASHPFRIYRLPARICATRKNLTINRALSQSDI